jgi:hypothetical protein
VCDEIGPASNAAIASLPRCVAGDDRWTSLFGGEDVECAVCCEEILKGQEVIVLTCAHAFHSACIRPWLKVRGSCPACRGKAERLTAEDREAFWRELEKNATFEAERAAESPPRSEKRDDDEAAHVDGDSGLEESAKLSFEAA